jgi:hypothetical protein
VAQKVIYTVLTGGYDHLQQPRVIDPDWDYVCFGDRDGQDGVWKLQRIPFEGSNVMRARWAKMHPHVLFPDYSYSVFMDANLCVIGPEFYVKLNNAVPLAILEHPQRDCVWDELRYCYLKDKVSTRTAVKWHRFLKKMDMPRHNGLAETCILYREHNYPGIVALDDLWWDYLVKSGGSRDQLCFTPALHKFGLVPVLLFGPGLNARNVPYIRYVNHPVTGPQNIPRKLNWANLKYNLRLLWRKAVLLCLR